VKTLVCVSGISLALAVVACIVVVVPGFNTVTIFLVVDVAD